MVPTFLCFNAFSMLISAPSVQDCNCVGLAAVNCVGMLLYVLSAVKSTNSIQQPSLSRPTQQVVGQPSSQSMAASGDAVQNRIDDITAQVGSTPAALCCADLSVKLPFLGLV